MLINYERFKIVFVIFEGPGIINSNSPSVALGSCAASQLASYPFFLLSCAAVLPAIQPFQTVIINFDDVQVPSIEGSLSVPIFTFTSLLFTSRSDLLTVAALDADENLLETLWILLILVEAVYVSVQTRQRPPLIVIFVQDNLILRAVSCTRLFIPEDFWHQAPVIQKQDDDLEDSRTATGDGHIVQPLRCSWSYPRL